MPLAISRMCGIITFASFLISVQAAYNLELSGGASGSNVIVESKVPKDFPGSGMLKSGSISIPCQRFGEERVCFILPRYDRGSMVFQVTDGGTEETISAKLSDGRITVGTAGKTMFVYQGHESELPRPDINAAFKRGGHIHPVYTPSGRLLTDDYAPNHVHHHGIWFPWTKTEFEGRTPDFWNMGDGKGKVEFVRFGQHWSGPVHAGFQAEHQFVDLMAPKPKVALKETWEVVAYALPSGGKKVWIFDMISTQRCATPSPLKLPKYHYGGLGFRGNWEWNGAAKTFFLTATGETNRVKGNETRGNWVYMGGDVGGIRAGITILCHPENFRAPQPMRLHPTEPFMCYAPSQLGDWALEPGKDYVSRYRFVAADGLPEAKSLDEMWRTYANPPRVKVVLK